MTTTFFQNGARRAAAALSVGALAATGLLAFSAAPASAAYPVTVQFTQRGTHTWTVPEGVSQVQLTVYGAQGGADPGNPHYGVGGLGARVRATVPVKQGQELAIVVAGQGGPGYSGSGGGASGGFASFHGSGGGGASRVEVGDDLVAVAGGGGGAAYGADGGDSGHDGTSTGRVQDGAPGKAGAMETDEMAGAAGATPIPHCGSSQEGFAGTIGLRDAGGTGGGLSDFDRYYTWVFTGGGGGGGGYFGGGGGGGGAFCPTWFSLFGYAGGGGGGSSFVHPGLTGGVTDGIHSGNGAVVVSFVDDDGPTAAPTVSPAPNASGWNNTDVTVDWGWSDSVSAIDPDHCDQPTTSSGATGIVDLAASCHDVAGNLGQATYRVRIDKTGPVADPWVQADGSILWQWSDSESGVDIRNCAYTSVAPPSRPATTTATCTDNAGNQTIATVSID